MTPDTKDCSLENLYTLFEDLKENLDDLCSSFNCLSSELGLAMDDLSDELEDVKTQFICVGSLLTRYAKRTDGKKTAVHYSPLYVREKARAEYKYSHPDSDLPF